MRRDVDMTYETIYTDKLVAELAEIGVCVPPKDQMTCYRCPDADTCPHAWDLYNTDRDCLADK
jgi:hypothetical protein